MQWGELKGIVDGNKSHTDSTLHTTQGMYREKRIGSLREYIAQQK